MVSKQIRISLLTLLGLVLLLGCQASLAPAYDQAIVEKVTENSELAMRFFAEVEEGTNIDGFYKRQATYNTLIGAFESLQLQARARPVPDNVAIGKINEILQEKGNPALTENYPSAFAFGQIANTFRKMKEVDREKSLKPSAIQAFKGQVEIFLDQAITYESFLNR